MVNKEIAEHSEHWTPICGSTVFFLPIYPWKWIRIKSRVEQYPWTRTILSCGSRKCEPLPSSTLGKILCAHSSPSSRFRGEKKLLLKNISAWLTALSAECGRTPDNRPVNKLKWWKNCGHLRVLAVFGGGGGEEEERQHSLSFEETSHPIWVLLCNMVRVRNTISSFGVVVK